MTTAALPQMKHYWHHLEHGFWFQNAYEQLFAELHDKKPSQWVEIGSYYGGSMAWLGVETVNSGKPVVSVHVLRLVQLLVRIARAFPRAD